MKMIKNILGRSNSTYTLSTQEAVQVKITWLRLGSEWVILKVIQPTRWKQGGGSSAPLNSDFDKKVVLVEKGN